VIARTSHTSPDPVERRRRRGGGRRGGKRLAFNALAGLLLLGIVSAWAISIASAYRGRRDAPAGHRDPPPLTSSVARTVGASLTDPRAASTAYLDDAALRGALAEMRGQSGKLKAVIRAPNADLAEEAEANVAATYEGEKGNEVTSDKLTAPADPGIYKLAVQLGKISQPIGDLRVITMVPFAEKKNDRIGLYYLGSWPFENGGKPKAASYANPTGFIEVTPENRGTEVSEHFKLGDFLTKDQPTVWPKYLLLEPKLVDKLELTIEELRREGHRVDHVFVMSGFRTPRYNKSGGNTGGRASLSRHMYGDASDVYVDNDRDGQPDDLNGDGKVDLQDSKVFADAAEKVEQRYPALVGGIGIYKACCGHGPFTHIDTRGFRARWYGEGAG
jgi:hypothetical protein